MIYSAIREAEPWTPVSVIAGLLILAAIGYLFWRETKKP
jgi:LPXTG-motif cell wall-anchored protein